MDLKNITRVITGHDEQGNAIVLENSVISNVHHLKNAPGTVFHEVWSTDEQAIISSETPDVTLGQLTLPPPLKGTRFRFVDIPPDHIYVDQISPEALKATFIELGSSAASTSNSASKHPLMHRTETIDYGIVISGSITLLLDEEEIVVPENGVIVQRGTNHAWSNRTDQICRMAFILVDAKYDENLLNKLMG